MKNLDAFETVEFITGKIQKNRPETDISKCKKLIRQIMEIDFEYMRNTGVIANDQFSPDAFYDDDEAFSYVAERFFTECEEDDQFKMDLLEDYFEYFEQFMSEKGLLSWE